MKRVSLLCSAALVLLSLVSCASIDRQLWKMKQFDKVMVVDIEANDSINWQDENGKTSSGSNLSGKLTIGKVAAAVANSDSPQPVINDISQAIVKAISESGAFKLASYESADKSKIVRTKGFGGMTDRRIRPSGYEMFAYNQNSIRQTCANLGLDGLLVVKADFTKMMSSGISKTGTMKTSVTLEVIVYDKEGNTVWQQRSIRSATDTFGVIGGIYDSDKFGKSLVSATEVASKDLFTTLKGYIAKVQQPK
jgi:hypothetical protein